MAKSTLYTDALRQFQQKPIVTISAGTTCACLGDERNLREFLVADETAKQLRAAGHTVFFLLIDDSLDPLNLRQLRIAVDKDETLLERHKDWCGKPIGMLPDPWGCHMSYAAHFEHELSDRLQRLDCSPTMISTASLYTHGVYAPYIQMTLERYDEILTFLSGRFEGYQPEKLFWPLCPDCGYIDETQIESVTDGCAHFYCGRCERRHSQSAGEIKGKLNWKLDCAARWAIFNVDAEPFTKAYLEPKTGSFTIAQALCRTFFNGPEVMPLRYGLIKLAPSLSFKLLPSLPPDVLRSLMVTSASADLNLTEDKIRTAASQHDVNVGMSYLDTIKQRLPLWLLKPETLSHRERELLTHGIQFSRTFLDTDIRLQLPGRDQVKDISAETVRCLHDLLIHAYQLRCAGQHTPEEFTLLLRERINGLGDKKQDVLHRFRQLTGQEQGLPVPRMLWSLPMNYLAMLEHILELRMASISPPEVATIRLAA